MNRKRISIIVFIIGIITLVAGVIFLIIKLNSEPGLQDGEYLVSIGEWTLKSNDCEQLKCAQDIKCIDANGESMMQCRDSGVIWNFTEIGKGALTTNNHLNDYDFIWAIEGDKLKIETEWLYTMDDEFIYSIDQSNNTLTLTSGEEIVEFVPNKQE